MRIGFALLCALGQIAWAGAAQATITPIVVNGGAAPGEPGSTWQYFTNFAIDDSGTIALFGAVQPGSGGDLSSGIWRLDASSGWTQLSRNGGPAPGAAASEVFAQNDYPIPFLDGAGTVRFAGKLKETSGIPASQGSGLWMAPAGQPLELQIRQGRPAEGTTLGAIGPVGFASNQAGDTVLNAGDLNGGDIWRLSPSDELTSLIRYGAQVPGAPSGVTFAGTEQNSTMQINGSGAVAFQGLVAGSATTANDRTAFVAAPGGPVQIVAREGDPAEGIAGALYGDSVGALLTPSGEFALSAHLKTGVGGVTSANDAVIYAPAAIGGHVPLLREGDPAPGTSDGSHVQEPGLILGDDGQMVVAAGLAVPGGTGLEQALWRANSQGDLEMILRTGQGLSGLAPGAVIEGIGTVVLNDVGGMVVDVLFTPQPAEPDPQGGPPPFPPGFLPYREGIYYADPAGLFFPLLKEGDHVTLGPGDVRTLEHFFLAPFPDNAFNDRGELLVQGYFEGGTQSLLLITVPEPAPAPLLALGLVALAASRRDRLVRRRD
jgi:hypothetical protein